MDTLGNGVSNKKLKSVVDSASAAEKTEITKDAITKWDLNAAIEKAKVSSNFITIFSNF